MFAITGCRHCERRIVKMIAALIAAVLVSLAQSMAAAACPFCTSPGPTLTQRRETSTVVALAEFVSSQPTGQKFRIHSVLQGKDRVRKGDVVELPLAIGAKGGSLCLLFANQKRSAGKELAWTAVDVDETSYAYFVRSPSRRLPSAERLRYFAGYLESDDKTVCDDAYLEFAHATYLDVSQVVDALPMEKIRVWIVSEQLPPERRGFLGLALGLAASPEERAKNRELLYEIIVTPASDFRAGFDGILAGYLLLAAEDGLELIERQILANKDSADGDVRHAMSALRFYHQYAEKIPAARRSEALAHLLVRKEFAPATIADLSRSQAWDLLPRIADLFRDSDYPQPQTRRAVVGFLLACPTDEAARRLADLRREFPKQVSAAEEFLSFSGVTR